MLDKDSAPLFGCSYCTKIPLSFRDRSPWLVLRIVLVSTISLLLLLLHLITIIRLQKLSGPEMKISFDADGFVILEKVELHPLAICFKVLFRQCKRDLITPLASLISSSLLLILIFFELRFILIVFPSGISIVGELYNFLAPSAVFCGLNLVETIFSPTLHNCLFLKRNEAHQIINI